MIRQNITHILSSWKVDSLPRLMFDIKDELKSKGRLWLPLKFSQEFNIEIYQTIQQQISSELETHLYFLNEHCFHALLVENIRYEKPSNIMSFTKNIDGDFYVEITDMFVVNANHFKIKTFIHDHIETFFKDFTNQSTVLKLLLNYDLVATPIMSQDFKVKFKTFSELKINNNKRIIGEHCKWINSEREVTSVFNQIDHYLYEMIYKSCWKNLNYQTRNYLTQAEFKLRTAAVQQLHLLPQLLMNSLENYLNGLYSYINEYLSTKVSLINATIDHKIPFNISFANNFIEEYQKELRNLKHSLYKTLSSVNNKLGRSELLVIQYIDDCLHFIKLIETSLTLEKFSAIINLLKKAHDIHGQAIDINDALAIYDIQKNVQSLLGPTEHNPLLILMKNIKENSNISTLGQAA